jgi:hypothetical protein
VVAGEDQSGSVEILKGQKHLIVSHMKAFIRAVFCIALLICEILGAEPATKHRYRLVPDFPQLPAGWKLEAVSGVATDSRDNLLIFHRGQHPIIIFDQHGRMLRSFGDGMFSSAHGL